MPDCIATKDGIPFTPWIYYVFGDCTYGYLDGASVLLGYLSILFWLNAQFPQVIVNYRRGSADGLAINFLIIWLAGDAANLIGCILTDQLPFQRYLGIYFVFVDVCLVSQYFYYGKWNQRKSQPANINSNYYRKTHEDSFLAAFQHPSAQTPLLVQNGLVDDEMLPYSVSCSPNKWYTLTQPHHGGLDKMPSTGSSSSSVSAATTSTSPNRAATTTTTMGLMTIMLFGFHWSTSSSLTTTSSTTNLSSSSSLDMPHSKMIGTFFAWSCTTLYLLSRLPQIRKNIKRRSVQGLSPSLFICAACGNLAYTCSILLHPGQTRNSLLEALPYLLGSAGTLTFDLTIFLQLLYYTRQKQKSQQVQPSCLSLGDSA